MRRLELFLFVFGASILAYLYGVASKNWGLFPISIIESGWRGAKALKEVWDSEAGLPSGVVELTASPPVHHQASDTRPPNPPDELLLVVGRPYHLLDFCPELGCVAWLMDRQGTIYHAWPIDPAIQWGETLSGFPQPENITPIGTHVYENGDLLATFQGRNTFPFGVGVARLNKHGKLLWKKEINAHHWFDVGDDGLIYVGAHRLVDSPLDLEAGGQQLACDEMKVYEDWIIVLEPDGTIVDEFSLFDKFLRSGYAGLVELTRDTCDPLHLNDVRILKATDAEAYPEFTAGDLLVSTRSINAVAVLDHSSHLIKWITSGSMVAQHNPRFAGDNRILVFDNWGGTRNEGKGGSRIIEIDIPSHRVETLFPREDTPPSVDFYTDYAGHFDLDRERSRALVSLALQGRVLEIDLETGEILWEHDNIHNISAYNGKAETPVYARFGISAVYYTDVPKFLE